MRNQTNLNKRSNKWQLIGVVKQSSAGSAGSAEHSEEQVGSKHFLEPVQPLQVETDAQTKGVLLFASLIVSRGGSRRFSSSQLWQFSVSFVVSLVYKRRADSRGSADSALKLCELSSIASIASIACMRKLL